MLFSITVPMTKCPHLQQDRYLNALMKSTRVNIGTHGKLINFGKISTATYHQYKLPHIKKPPDQGRLFYYPNSFLTVDFLTAATSAITSPEYCAGLLSLFQRYPAPCATLTCALQAIFLTLDQQTRNRPWDESTTSHHWHQARLAPCQWRESVPNGSSLCPMQALGGRG